MQFDAVRRLTVQEGLAQLPGPEGKRSVQLFQHGTLQVKIYAPRGVDAQTPHDLDEVYVVAAGSGTYVHGARRYPCGVGDVLFAAASEVHRFEAFSPDFATWVFFYGPRGGEGVEGGRKGHDARAAGSEGPGA